MAVVRKTRILLVMVIGLIVFFTSRRYDYLPKTPAWMPNSPVSMGGKTPQQQRAPTNDQSPLTHETDPYSVSEYKQVETELVKDAHKLPHADAFLAHFQAVTRIPGMTMAQAKEPCVWPEGVKVNYQYGPGQEWVNTDRPDSEIAERRKQWQDFLDSGMIPYSDARNKFLGRGLVIVAGNQDTLKRVHVILRQLIRLNSSIAVEIHYWDDEMNENDKKKLGKMYFHTFFNDLSSPENIYKIDKRGIYVNYQLKTAAVLNSRFAEPLLLDSDNIPLFDPELLYESLTYREYGTVFWPDIARTRPQNPAWAITNTACRKDEYEQESGQLLVDKMKFFYHLQLAAWFNNDPSQRDYWSEFLLGDKDMFRFAWHALQTKFGRPRRWISSVGNENEGYYCGHSFAQWHPDDGIPGRGAGKGVAFIHGGLVKTTDLETIAWNREKKGGFYRHYKRAPHDANPLDSVDVGIKFDSAVYMPQHSDQFHGASCTDMFDVLARPIDELIPGFEGLFEDIGGYWMIDGDKGGGEAGDNVGGDGGADGGDEAGDNGGGEGEGEGGDNIGADDRDEGGEGEGNEG